jgi:hypothetical protein
VIRNYKIVKISHFFLLSTHFAFLFPTASKI